jgi:hypothetical protein
MGRLRPLQTAMGAALAIPLHVTRVTADMLCGVWVVQGNAPTGSSRPVGMTWGR